MKIEVLIHRILLLIKGKINFFQALNFILKKYSKEGPTVPYKPIRLGIFVTGRCNLKCTMCLTHSPCIPDNPFKFKGSKDMDLITFKDIIKHYPSSIMISLIGNGEPLLNTDIFKMIQFAKRKNKRITIFSNGLILNKYFGQIFENEVESINISINAINSIEYKRFTGHDRDIYNACLRNLKELVRLKNKRDSGLTIHCSIIVDKLNYKEMPQMIQFAEDLGVDHVSLSHFMPNPTDKDEAKNRCLYISDIDAMYLIKELSLNEYSIDVTFPRLLDGNLNNRLCRDGLISMSIDGDGNVGGCERQLLNTTGQGKYYDKNVFNNDHFQDLRNKFLNGKGELSDPCKTCYNNTTCEEIFVKAKKK